MCSPTSASVPETPSLEATHERELRHAVGVPGRLDAGPRSRRVRRPPDHVRRRSTTGRLGWPPHSPSSVSAGATPSRSTSTTAPSTSRSCTPRSSSAPSRSTSTTGTSTTSSCTSSPTRPPRCWCSTARSATVSGRCGERAPGARRVHPGRRRQPSGGGRAGLRGRRSPSTSRRRACARSGDDRFILYTGGTTGMPKGVVWAHDDLFTTLGFPAYATLGLPIPTRGLGGRSGGGQDRASSAARPSR